jgi:flagellar biosynthetic protein FlhB
VPESAQERTEQPTSRRLRKARESGNVTQSNDLNSAAVLLAGLFALLIFGKGMGESLMWMFRAIYHELPTVNLDADKLTGYFRMGGIFMAKLLAPLLITVAVVGLVINYVQVGPLFTTQALTPKLNNLNPTGGMKRLFSARAWAEVVKGILKVILIGWIGYLTVKSALPKFVPLLDEGVPEILAAIVTVALKLAFRVGLAILVLGLLDWRFQKWQYIKQLKMTKQDVKEEYKQQEGDPKIKSRIRQIQLKTSLNRMIQKMPTADVVIANPIHLAVALKYDPETMSAPKVIAKGKRKLAERIKAIAIDNDIPIVEDPELARSLYKLADIGMEIPYELFQAVAEVLAMVYRLKEAV